MRDDDVMSTNSKASAWSHVRKKMSANDVLKKNPWQKWKQHGRFPFKMVLHLCLLGVATLQVFLSNNQHGEYYRSTRLAFQNFLLPEDCESDKPSPYPWGGKAPWSKGRSYVCNLYSLKDTFNAVKTAVNGFQELKDHSVDDFWPQEPQTLTVTATPSNMLNAEVCNVFSPQPACRNTITSIYEVNSTDLGPFSLNPSKKELRTFMETLKFMYVTGRINTYEVGYLYTACITWEVEIGFDFQARSEVKVWMHVNIQEDWCDNADERTFAALFVDTVWINWITLTIAIPYLYLVTISISKSFQVYNRIRKVIMLLEEKSRQTRRGRKHSDRTGSPSTTMPKSAQPPDSRDEDHAAAVVDDSLRILLERVGMPQLLDKLMEEGIATVQDILAVSPQELEQQVGLHRMQARKLMQAACNKKAPVEQHISPSMPGIDPQWRYRGRTQSSDNWMSAGRHMHDIDDDDDSDDDNTVTISWSHMKCSDRCKFFRSWMLMSFFSTLSIIMGSCYRLYVAFIGNRTGASDDFGLLMIDSVGICLVWINTIHYLEHNHEFYQLVLTLQIGLPRVLRFLMGVFPVLMAYALVGIVFFSRVTTFFGTFGSSLITLFAVMNGDEMADSFNQVVGEFPIVGNIYWFSFVILFIFVVLNVFVAIVEAAHEATERLHWQKYGTPMVGPSEPVNERILNKVMQTIIDGKGSDPSSDLAALEAAIQDQLTSVEMSSPTSATAPLMDESQTVRALLRAVSDAKDNGNFEDL